MLPGELSFDLWRSPVGTVPVPLSGAGGGGAHLGHCGPRCLLDLILLCVLPAPFIVFSSCH